jgi:hypothetical protein
MEFTEEEQAVFTVEINPFIPESSAINSVTLPQV